MAEILLPCPFCGEEAGCPTVKLDRIEVHQILCMCCATEVHGKLNTKESAIERWNTRTLASSPTAAACPFMLSDCNLTEADLCPTCGMDADRKGGPCVADRTAADRDKDAEIARLREALTESEAQARRFAGLYSEGSDGRNTLLIMADNIAALTQGKD